MDSATLAAQIDSGQPPYDLSLSVIQESIAAFYLAGSSRAPVRAGGFVGSVAEGGSVNCDTVTFCVHGNGTHTEGVGHIRKERECVTQLVSPASVFMLPATLLTITPEPFGESGDTYGEQAQTSDLVISRRSLEKALEAAASRRDVPKSEYLTGLVLRTLPNDASKKNRTYSGANPAYFTREAMQWMRTQRVRHLVCDLPSVDREDDGGFMRAHSTFWGVDCETSEGPEMALDRRSCSITELAFVDPSYSLEDGPYALSLQLAPFLMDATPSRPLLLPLRSE